MASKKLAPTVAKPGITLLGLTDINNTMGMIDFVKCCRQHVIYLLLGEITEEMGFPGMTVEKMEKMPLQPDPRY